MRASFRRIVVPLVIVAIWPFVSIIISPGTVGARGDWAVEPLWRQTLKLAADVGYVWQRNYLGYPNFRNTGDYLGQVVFAAFARLHLGGDVVSKAVLICSYALAVIFMYRFARSLGASAKGSVLASIVYSLTPIVFESTIYGYVLFLISYAVFPEWARRLNLLLTEKGVSLSDLAALALVTRITLSQDNFVILLVIYFCVAVLWLARPKGRAIIALTSRLAIIAVCVALMLAPSILAVLSARSAATGQLSQQSHVWNTFLAPPPWQALLLDGGSYADVYEASHAFPVWAISGYALCLAALSVPAWRRSSAALMLFSLFAVSLFIYKGTHAPLGEINAFFQSLPGAILLRNLSYVTVLSALAMGVLFAFFFDLVCAGAHRKTAYVTALVLVLVHSWPFLAPRFSNQLQTYTLPAAYAALYNNLAARSEGRDLYLPLTQPMNVEGSLYAGQDPMFFGSPRPAVGNYENSPVERFLVSSIHEGLPQIANLLARLNIDHIIVRRDFHSALQSFVPAYQADRWLPSADAALIQALPHYRLESEYRAEGRSIASVYRADRSANAAYIATDVVCAGNDLRSLAVVKPQTAVLFNNEQNIIGCGGAQKHSESTWKPLFLRPGQGSLSEAWTDSWWSDYLLATSAVGDLATTSTSPLIVPLPADTARVRISYLTHPAGGKLEVLDDDQLNEQGVVDHMHRLIELEGTSDSARWLDREVSLPPGSKTIEIAPESPGALTAISSVSVPSVDSDISARSVNLAGRAVITALIRDDPTRAHGKIIVKTPGPVLVVFRENVDAGWRFETSGAHIAAHLSADGYANAWIVSFTSLGDHEFVINYGPQRAYALGMRIALMCFIVLTVVALVPVFLRGRSLVGPPADTVTTA